MRAGGKCDFHHLLERPASGSSKTWQRTLLWKPKVLAMVNLVAAAEGGPLSAPLVQRVIYKWNSGMRSNRTHAGEGIQLIIDQSQENCE